MNRQDAIELLEKKKGNISIFNMKPDEIEEFKAYSIGISAIKRYIRQKPVKTEKDDDESFDTEIAFECPECGTLIKEAYKKPTFCDNYKCGQAFLW